MSETLSSELDVRTIPKPQRHPLIFSRFDGLDVGESFVLVNDHDPRHLHEEFERDLPGAYSWTYLPTDERRLFRIQITRLSLSGVPRLLGNTVGLLDVAPQSDAAGAIWRLEPRERQLDANVIQLAAGGSIQTHDGPDLDVLIHVLSGSGEVETVSGTLELAVGSLAWLPRRSRRSIRAGADGLAYLSIHQRREGLSIGTAR